MRISPCLLWLAAACAAPDASSPPAPSAPGAPPAAAPLSAAVAPARPIARAAAAQNGEARQNPFGVPEELDDGGADFAPIDRDPSIATVEAELGAPVGRRPAHHAEVSRLWRAWAKQSPRVRLEHAGRTHEGRDLWFGVVTSPRNLERLDAILADLGRLSDPRGLSSADERAIVERSPAVAWMAYSIHGDEMSGVDAGLALAYQLIADRGEATARMLEDLVIVFDPMQNPDGRERMLSLVESSAGSVLDLGTVGLARGRWPYGRGNHYLFDMNRDWMAGVAPETRARWAGVRKFVPQLFVDSHEMDALDTFLMYPQAQPRHPDLPKTLHKWHGVFGDEAAAAFDAHGWSYYTREWADGWGPFYSDAWGSLNGAIGILYEQARFGGTAVRRETGEIATYRDAVRHQWTASFSNLRSLQRHRRDVLADFVANRRENCDTAREDGGRAFVIRSGSAPSRERWLIETLLAQGVEVHRAKSDLQVSNYVSALGERADTRQLAAGAWIVPAAQPQGSLVRAFLNFDPRFSKSVLEEERKELERKASSKMYDVTAWNLGHALGLDCGWAAVSLADCERVDTVPPPHAGVIPASDPAARVYAWAIDGSDDACVRFAAQGLASGLALQVGDEAFTAAGRRFTRASILVRAHENPDLDAATVDRIARATGAAAFALTTARSPDESADLGGGHFRPLHAPRIALAAGAQVSTEGFGHVWHLIDRELRLPCTLVDGSFLGRYDLREFDVLILPSGSFDLARAADDLQAWVRSGGTLIAIEDSAAALCAPDLNLSEVRERSDVLSELEVFAEAAEREARSRKIEIDEALVYGDAVAAPAALDARTEASEPDDDAPAESDEALERRDAYETRFAPSGVALRGRVDPDAWITAGAEGELAVFYAGAQVLCAKPPAVAAVRLAPAEELRLSGLVWPEARERLSKAAWLTVERRGRGQVILFASQPNFRCYWMSGARLLANAIVLGPGLGADPVR